MKLICSKASLLKGVSIVSKAVPSRTTMPILNCILIDASANEIKLTANDMELGIETVIEGEIVERGIIALDAKFFSEIVRKLPDNDVVIESDDTFQTTITCEKAKFNIVGKSGEDFSYLPYIEKNESISISQFTLKDVVRQTIFSIADNDTNKLMTGELFEINENRLRVVSLDGHRISIRNIELKESYSPLKVVVPGKTLQEISKILTGEAEDMVDIFFADNHILFEFDETKVVSRLIEGEYFHIDQMLSSDYDTKVKINKREFLNCIDRATLLPPSYTFPAQSFPVSFQVDKSSKTPYTTKVIHICSEGSCCGCPFLMALKGGSCAMDVHEPCQVGNKAALRGIFPCAAGSPAPS